jgi:signal transduction histidine kinase
MTGRTGVPVSVHVDVAVSAHVGVPVSAHVDVQCPLPAEVQVALYRIAQEALNNVAKHAEASQVEVHWNCQVDRATLAIRDDGRGFDVDSIQTGHFGVGIMRERAASVGAELQIESESGRGTQVTAVWIADDGQRTTDDG